MKTNLFKYFAIFFGWIEMLCFSGVIFGLNSLYETLKKENLFSDYCNFTQNLNRTNNETSHSCVTQNKFFGYILITTMTSQCILALPLGFFFDRFGQKICKFCVATLFLLACIFFALSLKSSPMLVYVSAFLFGISAQFLLFCNIALGRLFPKFQNLIVSTFSGSMDTSSVIFTFFALAHRYGVRLMVSFLSLGLSGFIIMASSAIFIMKYVEEYFAKLKLPNEIMISTDNLNNQKYLLTDVEKEPPSNVEENGVVKPDGIDNKDSTRLPLLESEFYKPHCKQASPANLDITLNIVDNRKTGEFCEEGKIETNDESSKSLLTEPESNQYQTKETFPDSICFKPETKLNGKVNEETPNKSNNDLMDELQAITNKKYPNMKTILTSRHFLFQLGFFVILYFRFSYFFVELSLQLQYNFSKKPHLIGKLLSETNYFFLCGIFISPIAGFIVDFSKKSFFKKYNPSWKGDFIYNSVMQCFVTPQLICCICNLILSVTIIIPNISSVYVTFACVTITRAFLFSLNSSYILQAFPGKFFGQTMGITILIAGIISFIQYALLFRDLYSLNVVNFVLIGFSCLTFLQPLTLLFIRQ